MQQLTILVLCMVLPFADGTCRATGAWTGQKAVDDWCVTNCARGHCPQSHCVCDGSSAQSNARQNTMNCKAVNAWKGQAAVDAWCNTNCAVGNCPATHCLCQASANTQTNILVNGGSCKGIGGNTDDWCILVCYFGYCPASRCSCT
eukprot:Seg2271.5 transcript_id=Seg2271.5/GoldUCD/mRNA.D3Y31 product="hypothetical protein" protein_id=Seg2271.5/GoldUCD/D3Y31